MATAWAEEWIGVRVKVKGWGRVHVAVEAASVQAAEVAGVR